MADTLRCVYYARLAIAPDARWALHARSDAAEVFRRIASDPDEMMIEYDRRVRHFEVIE
jgi:hypothetical protein